MQTNFIIVFIGKLSYQAWNARLDLKGFCLNTMNDRFVSIFPSQHWMCVECENPTKWVFHSALVTTYQWKPESKIQWTAMCSIILIGLNHNWFSLMFWHRAYWMCACLCKLVYWHLFYIYVCSMYDYLQKLTLLHAIDLLKPQNWQFVEPLDIFLFHVSN